MDFRTVSGNSSSNNEDLNSRNFGVHKFLTKLKTLLRLIRTNRGIFDKRKIDVQTSANEL